MGDDFGAHVEQLHAKKRAARAVMVVPPTGEINRGSCGEVVLLKPDLETVDKAKIVGGEVSRD
jgi:hypothetical protein